MGNAPCVVLICRGGNLDTSNSKFLILKRLLRTIIYKRSHYAYYTGEEIIERLNSNRKVFIQKHNKSLAGYIYVEAEPEFGEGRYLRSSSIM